MAQHSIKKTVIEKGGEQFLRTETTYITLTPQKDIEEKKKKLDEKYAKELEEIKDLEDSIKLFNINKK